MESGASRALLERLAAQPGLALFPGEPLARRTTLRIGGAPDWAAEVSTESGLSALVAGCRELGIPFLLLGLGSNVLVPDGGLPGVAARLAGGLKSVHFRGRWVSAGGGALLAQVARASARRGLAGLEALAGFPSTVGGAVRMNAGSYGREMKDVVRSVRLVTRDGHRLRVSMAELDPSYRTTALRGSGGVVTRVLFELSSGEPAALLARIDELNARRWTALPSGQPNAGSIFKNPPGDYAGRLLEACGLKGVSVGGALVSPRHANVIVNTGGASAADVVALMRRMRAAVVERFGVELEPELVLLGGLAEELEGR